LADESVLLKETSEHEFPDLPQSSRDRIAAAQLDADAILRFSQAEVDYLAEQARKLGFDPSGVIYLPGSLLMELALGESDAGRQRSARYLLAAVAIEYWKLLKPDVEKFRAKVDSIVGPIAQKFGLGPSVLDVYVRYLQALALRERAGLARSSLAGQTEPSICLSNEAARTLRASVTPLKKSEAAVKKCNQSSLLVSKAQQRLDRRDSQREDQLGQLVEIGAMRLRNLQEKLEQGGADGKSCDSKSIEMQLRSESKGLRQEMVAVAQAAAVDAVREFAAGLLLLPNRLEVRAYLVRDYAGRVVSDIRHALRTSQVFQMEPLLPWRQDPIAQEAIRFCEDSLAKRAQTEGGEVLGSTIEPNGSEPRTWPPVVQEWESLKSTRERSAGTHERIPESDLRRIIAEQSGAKPDDVSETQIDHAALELCRHYGSFLMIPLASSELRSTADTSPYAVATQDSAFWKEREDEFRKHDTGHNTVLAASWSSLSDTWRFQVSGSTHLPSAESMQLFKSLAREAAKGLGSKRGADSWIDWLDLLRCARDEDTGKNLYAQVASLSFVVSERGRDQMIRAGEDVPAGALIEFGQETDGVARRLYWDGSSANIECLFRISANLCLRLRSLTGHTVPSPLETAPAIVERARQPKPSDPIQLESEGTLNWEDSNVNRNMSDPVAMERAALLTAYKVRGKQQGIHISDAMVAKAANPGKWNERTMVGWWKRNDPRCKLRHDKKIRAVLEREPSSIWSPNLKPRRTAQ
jgi:hypothetical protein